MQKPVIIAVSSCKVTEYARNLQLTATSTTFYYLNPEIPELGHLFAEFTTKYDLKPLLEISKTRYKDLEKEKTRNRFPISTLLQKNPDSYKAVRFTSEATITRINTGRDWYRISTKGRKTKPNWTKPSTDSKRAKKSKVRVKKSTESQPREAESGKRVDFYFDDILDKPLQITDSATAELQTLGETSSSAKGTLLLEMPDTHSPATPAAVVPIRQIPLPSPPSTVKEATTLTSKEVTLLIDQTASMGNLHETEETKSDRAKTLKRALFSTEPEEQKKNKSEQ
ncbi:hypothetical protein Tco_0500911 [Tanacetum coccineum]